MTEVQIREALHQIARRELDWTGDALPDGELARHFDSLQRMTLAVAMEDRFRIILEPEDEERIVTVHDLVAIVRSKIDA